MEAYTGAASQPQIMATNNAFKIVLLNVNFTAMAAKILQQQHLRNCATAWHRRSTVNR